MKRTEKILRLVAVGFSATELSRASTGLLDSTYESAKGLMKSKEEEVRRVIDREGRRANRKKEEVAQRQRNEKIEGTWLRTWKPLPPIQSTYVDVSGLARKISDKRHEMEKSKALFRQTGHRAYANAANRAKTEIQTFEGYLAHLTQETT